MAQDSKDIFPKDKYLTVLDTPSTTDESPFFKKKREDALEVLRKCGMPRHLTKEQLGAEFIWDEEKKEWILFEI